MTYRTFKKEVKELITAAEAAEFKVTDTNAKSVIASAILKLKGSFELRETPGESIRDVENKVKSELKKREEEEAVATLKAEIKGIEKAWELEQRQLVQLEKVEIAHLKVDHDIVKEVRKAKDDSEKAVDILTGLNSKLKDTVRLNQAINYLLINIMKTGSRQQHAINLSFKLKELLERKNLPARQKHVLGLMTKLTITHAEHNQKEKQMELQLRELARQLITLDNVISKIIGGLITIAESNEGKLEGDEVDELIRGLVRDEGAAKQVIAAMEKIEQEFLKLVQQDKAIYQRLGSDYWHELTEIARTA